MKRVQINFLLPLLLNLLFNISLHAEENYFSVKRPDTIVISIKDERLLKLTRTVLQSKQPGTVGFLIKNFFLHSSTYHLSINTNIILPDSLFGFVVPGDFTKDKYVSNVILNKHSLLWASDEIIVSVIIHELLHAYLDFTRDKNLFFDHEEMANDYRPLLKNSIMQIYPNCEKELVEALAWGGLVFTKAFEELKRKQPQKAIEIKTRLFEESKKFKETVVSSN
ncbi:MAG: hypothetical protein O9340_12420 [Cyclobacteriaceae bacterium]|nr:hypothetical protein [Cyclobacteriaceae bacterium]